MVSDPERQAGRFIPAVRQAIKLLLMPDFDPQYGTCQCARSGIRPAPAVRNILRHMAHAVKITGPICVCVASCGAPEDQFVDGHIASGAHGQRAFKEMLKAIGRYRLAGATPQANMTALAEIDAWPSYAPQLSDFGTRVSTCGNSCAWAWSFRMANQAGGCVLALSNVEWRDVPGAAGESASIDSTSAVTVYCIMASERV